MSQGFQGPAGPQPGQSRIPSDPAAAPTRDQAPSAQPGSFASPPFASPPFASPATAGHAGPPTGPGFAAAQGQPPAFGQGPPAPVGQPLSFGRPPSQQPPSQQPPPNPAGPNLAGSNVAGQAPGFGPQSFAHPSAAGPAYSNQGAAAYPNQGAAAYPNQGAHPNQGAAGVVPTPMRPPSSQPKAQSNAWIVWLVAGLGCFGLVAAIGVVGLGVAFYYAAEQESAYAGSGDFERALMGDEYADGYYDDSYGAASDPVVGGGGLGAIGAPVAIERYNVQVSADLPSRGPADAPVTIVEFADFQCPFCARATQSLRSLEDEFPGQIRVVFRNYPLPFHDRADAAAQLAIEAHQTGGNDRFWQAHDLLFADTQQLGEADLLRHADRLGINRNAARAAIRQRRHADRIAIDGAVAQGLGITGTPTFFINGRVVQGAQPLETFRALVVQEIAEVAALEARGVPRDRAYEQLVGGGMPMIAP